MVLSHCLKTDFYDSLTVGLSPKPSVISTVFSFTTKQHQFTQLPHLYYMDRFCFCFFQEMDRRKISIFTL